jgi:hypothetical protein
VIHFWLSDKKSSPSITWRCAFYPTLHSTSYLVSSCRGWQLIITLHWSLPFGATSHVIIWGFSRGLHYSVLIIILLLFNLKIIYFYSIVIIESTFLNLVLLNYSFFWFMLHLLDLNRIVVIIRKKHVFFNILQIKVSQKFFQVLIFLFNFNKKFLSMRPSLGTRTSTNMLLHFLPFFAK